MDGQNWQMVLVATIQMNACIQMGLYVTNMNGSIATATFNDVLVIESGTLNLAMPNVSDGPVSVQNLPANFELYPNPATHEVYVDMLGLQDKKVDINIYNAVGQRVRQIEIDEVQDGPQKIDLYQFNPGTYLIEVISKDYRQIKKLMVH